MGLHVHVGSQMMGLGPLRQAAKAVVELVAELSDDGVVVEHLDMGGGLGIPYDGEQVPSVTAYATELIKIVERSGLTLIIEPGRAIVGPAGVLLASVVDVKPKIDGGLFVVLDAGMSELMRPALYGAHHQIIPVEKSNCELVTCDVVGPICESSDVFGVGRMLPRPEVGTCLLYTSDAADE